MFWASRKLLPLNIKVTLKSAFPGCSKPPTVQTYELQMELSAASSECVCRFFLRAQRVICAKSECRELLTGADSHIGHQRFMCALIALIKMMLYCTYIVVFVESV